MREIAAAHFQDLQARICAALEAFEPTVRFGSDRWRRDGGGGGGNSRIIEGGEVFEKGGVLFSEVQVPREEMAPELAANLPGDGDHLWASGVSLILHPRNPHVPTVHANFRAIEFGEASWFGGGMDLTPVYPYTRDAVGMHKHLKATCDRFDPAYYPRFKAWCDRYFFLPHRGEARGVGGLFFDQLTPSAEHTREARWSFVKACGEAFLEVYVPIVERRYRTPWTEAQRDFQALRRGRYVEFNLLHDRGTKFGLQTGGRTESILASMPPRATWSYNHTPAPGSPEAAIYDAILPRDWASMPWPEEDGLWG